MNQQRKISIAIAGAYGKMGREAVNTLLADERFHVSSILVRNVGQAGQFPEDIRAYSSPKELLLQERPNVWLDLTDAQSVVSHVDLCLEYGVRPVIGATGYADSDLRRWKEACEAQSLGAVAVPNFAIGALLMMRFAEEAARFMQNAEIIELHHADKRDAPSGTAKRTASRMSEVSGRDVPIHSVRLPGLVAHQEVLFGGVGEVLTIRHDSMSRQCFMPGVRIACAKVMDLKTMVYGLEHLLW